MNLFRRPIAATLSLLLLSSCQTVRVSGPDAYVPESASDVESVAILGLNDLHGAITPQSLKTREIDASQAVTYERGGLALLASHVQRLRSQFGNRLLVLDAGDLFQGSLESNLEEGAPMVSFYNSIGLSAAAIGNHEFDFGPVGPEGSSGDPLGALKARMKEARYPYLAANLIDHATGKPPELPNFSPSTLLSAGRLKIGVIGLSTLQTPTTTRPEFVRGLEFRPMKESVLAESAKLRKQGADLIVVTAHAGLFCELGGGKPGHQIRSPKDPLGVCDAVGSANAEGEISKLLKSLPRGSVDAVVSGHTHSVVHHWINDVPVIQGGTRGLYFNVIYLSYDLRNKRVLLDRTRIEGPVPICPKVFSRQGDCNGDVPAPSAGRGSLVSPTFHGEPIGPDPATEALLLPVLDRVAAAKRRVIGKVAQSVEIERLRESAMGNLVSDAIRAQVGADVAIMNNGGMRAPFEPGDLTYGDLFKTLPFDNFVSLLRVTGRELKLILEIVESGSKGFFPVSGVKLTLLHPEVPTKSRDLNQDGRTELWEIDRLVSARMADGSPIDDDKIYKLATIDFLVQGGDDLGWIMGRIPKDRIEIQAGGLLRDTVEKHIQRIGVLNAADQPLVDSKNPRLQFTRVATSERTKSKRPSRKRRRR